MIKVLIISHMYPSSYDEVYGSFVHYQVKELTKQGIEIKVVSPRPWAPFPINRMSKKWKAYSEIPQKQIRENIEIFYPRYIEFPRAYLDNYSGEFMYLAVKSIINSIYNKFKFDLIHAHTAYPDGYAAIRLKLKYNIPLIVTVHGLDVCSCAPYKPLIERSQILCKKIIEVFSTADKIVGVSSLVRNSIIRYYHDSQKVIYINNGIPIDKVKLKSTWNRGQRIKIISVGYLDKRKGHEFVIRSLTDLIKDGFKLEYTIVGDGENRKFLETLVEEFGLKNIVSILGMKSQDEVFRSLSEADIFCLPSWDEALGVVYLEAMATGLPVIACKGQGIIDVIEDKYNGLLVEPKNLESVQSALRILITNTDLCRKIGQKARQRVLDNFTWQRNANKYIELYKEILD
ncbi:glycosyltransferase [Bacteroidota bacterium]